MKTFFLLVGAPGEKVGVYGKRKPARADNPSMRCCALFTITHETALLWLGRKRINRGIHTVRIFIEPKEGSMRA